MNPRRLHRETIFSINSADLGSAIRTESFLEAQGEVKVTATGWKCASRLEHGIRSADVPVHRKLSHRGHPRIFAAVESSSVAADRNVRAPLNTLTRRL